MKKLLLLFTLLMSSFGFSQVYYSENFTAEQTLATSGWTLFNVDGDAGTANNWFRTTSNGNGVMGSFSWYNAALTPNNYAFTPAINLTAASGTIKLFYKHVSTDADWDIEKYTVYVTTTPTVAAALASTPLHSQTTMNGINTLTQMTLDMSAYAGQTVYVCFRHHGVSDQFNILIDDISVEKIVAVDAEALSVNLSNTIAQGSTVVTGTIKNNGTSALTSVNVNYQVDGGAVNTHLLSGLNLAYGETYDFSHSVNWSATPGTHSVVVSVSNPNNTTDGNTSNDSKTKSILVVNEIFPKTVVYEEGTGPWCGWCVRGHVGLKDMHHNHNDDTWIGIAVHNGSTNPMKLAEYDTAIGNYISGYPSGLINRGSEEVDPGYSSLNAAYQAEMLRVPTGKINIISQSWNPTTRQISVQVEAKFALDMANANYNVGVVVIENEVTGTTSEYSQQNYYNTNGIDIIDWEGINWRYLGQPIPAANMVYQHVGRALLGGYNGQSGVVPGAVTYNVPYTYTFTHTLPAGQDENEVELVALLLDNSTASKEIVNAKKVALNTALNVNSFENLDYSFYPNPSNGIVQFSTQKELSVSVVDLLGKTVYSNSSVFDNNSIDLSNLVEGVYLINVTDGVSSDSKKLIIKK